MNYHEDNPKSIHLKTMFGLGLFCTANLLYFITCYSWVVIHTLIKVIINSGI